jgi:hypothetical protein
MSRSFDANASRATTITRYDTIEMGSSAINAGVIQGLR